VTAVIGRITMRTIDPALKERLGLRAAECGHSMEAEVRTILEATLLEPEEGPKLNSTR
jgi:plasmid stability protein